MLILLGVGSGMVLIMYSILIMLYHGVFEEGLLIAFIHFGGMIFLYILFMLIYSLTIISNLFQIKILGKKENLYVKFKKNFSDIMLKNEILSCAAITLVIILTFIFIYTEDILEYDLIETERTEIYLLSDHDLDIAVFKTGSQYKYWVEGEIGYKEETISSNNVHIVEVDNKPPALVKMEYVHENIFLHYLMIGFRETNYIFEVPRNSINFD